MKYAIISTVSSDRFDYKMAADSAGQPRLAQLAIIFVGDDQVPQDAITYTVKSDGWAMSNEATIASGLTDEQLDGPNGIAVWNVCNAYVGLLESRHVIVAYGAPHHLKLMRGECRRAGFPDSYAATQSIDLCRAMVDVCRLPMPSGRKGFKLPRFEEACAALGAECPPVRDAAVSARLSLGMFRALSDRGLLPAPRLPGND